ncbi:hypothetical protein AB0I81_45970 [Nonomuraea sp. NPDC050404]|uniref:hypothetical protein n=1 Tax=Nonomuraea sp. NPDC050404 TaxID=3155783 RepID=UPI0033E0D7B8
MADESSVTYGEVVATGEREAWAFGWDRVGLTAWIPMADGPRRPTAFHWDGNRWAKSDFPVKDGGVGAVAASGPANVWVVAGGGVLRWDGRAWAMVRELPATALAVTAEDDVWVFGDHLAWHYDGATWTERRVPFHAFRVSARSASDIWALDVDARTVHRFDGEHWTPVDLASVLPKVPPAASDSPPAPDHDSLSVPDHDLPPVPDHVQLTAITADSSGVWITGEIGMSSFLLSQSGSGWRREDTSATAGRMVRNLPPVPDGRGGHWFLGSTDVNGDDSALAHRDSSGRWTKVAAGGELTSLSAVPGGPLLATGVIGKASGVFRAASP